MKFVAEGLRSRWDDVGFVSKVQGFQLFYRSFVLRIMLACSEHRSCQTTWCCCQQRQDFNCTVLGMVVRIVAQLNNFTCMNEPYLTWQPV